MPALHHRRLTTDYFCRLCSGQSGTYCSSTKDSSPRSLEGSDSYANSATDSDYSPFTNLRQPRPVGAVQIGVFASDKGATFAPTNLMSTRCEFPLRFTITFGFVRVADVAAWQFYAWRRIPCVMHKAGEGNLIERIGTSDQ